MIEILPLNSLRSFNYDYSRYISTGEFKLSERLNGFDDMLLSTYFVYSNRESLRF